MQKSTKCWGVTGLYFSRSVCNKLHWEKKKNYALKLAAVFKSCQTIA